MKKRFLVLTLILAVSLSNLIIAQDEADLIIWNGKIITPRGYRDKYTLSGE